MGEGIKDFILRLCESFNRWQSVDCDYVGSVGSVQFARGLREGPVKQELQQELRLASPEMYVEAACNEALALEWENNARSNDTLAYLAHAALPSPSPAPIPLM